MAGLSVEAKGLQSIVTLYQMHTENKAPLWALYTGKSLVVVNNSTNEDEAFQMLQQQLKVLEVARSTAIYELRFYNVPKGAKKANEEIEIDVSSPYRGSFRFKMYDPYTMDASSVTPYRENYIPNAEIVKMIELQNQQIEQLKQMVLAEEKEEDLEPAERIIGFIDNSPTVQNLLGALAGFITNKITGNSRPAMGVVNGIPEQPGDRVTAAVNRLLKVDPNFIDVLESLADMAENNPGKYNMAKNLL